MKSAKDRISRSIVGVFAHPDDEIPICGLLRRAQESGDHTHLICATRGGRNRNPHVVTCDDIVAIRTEEYQRVCSAIGADHSFLDLPDNGANQWDELDAEQRLINELVRIDPDIVIAVDRGGTSHPDHMKISDLTTSAFANLPRKDGRSLYYLTGFSSIRAANVFSILLFPKKMRARVLSLCAPIGSRIYRINLTRFELSRKIGLIFHHASQFPDEKGRYYSMPLLVFRWIMRRERYRRHGEPEQDRTTVMNVEYLP
ncbi:MAG: PIG-L family deacetylase [Spirochaetales bacterium]|jgi:mycothiol S-conjugate amidase|nr:PIG-L family deacetylase [Spirochaetales bacterium]